jgi:hypothetical protein
MRLPYQLVCGALAVSLVFACSSSDGPPSVDPASGGGGGGGASSGTPGSSSSSSGSSGANTAPTGPMCAGDTGKLGFNVGDTIGKLEVRSCETNEIATIDNLCKAKATWLFHGHTHCPPAAETAGFTDEVASEMASKDVAIVHIVYDDSGTSCEVWKKKYALGGITNVKLYADPDGAIFQKIKLTDNFAPSVFINSKHVITYKKHQMTKAEVLSRFDEALKSE